jgi:Domain of unknown function (DU1801)
MPENKTKPTRVSVDAFLSGVADKGRRRDAETVRAMMERLSGEPGVMWGPTMVGFGRYRYKYASGHGGEYFRVGFSPRAKELVVYIMCGFPRNQPLMDRLGKYRAGKSCLYIKRLADVDETVLADLIRAALGFMRSHYPDDA